MKFRGSPRAAFTLVELLVSIGVLLILVLVIAQLFNGAAMTATGSRKRLDADGIARAVFDRMEGDFERILKRPDVDYDFAKQPGNDTMYFYAESSGYPGASGTAGSTVSLVGYRINSQYQLERLGQRLAWSGAPGVIFLTNSPSPSATGAIAVDFSQVINDTNPADSNYYYDVIGDGVFRMEYSFELKDGSYSSNAFLAPDTSCDGTGLSDVAAVVVAIAVLDSASKRTVPTQTNSNNELVPQLGLAAGLLKDFAPNTSHPASPELMDQQWNHDWLTYIGNSQATGLLPVAASQVRIYQRYFYLNNQ
jgi:hypothetical protein